MENREGDRDANINVPVEGNTYAIFDSDADACVCHRRTGVLPEGTRS
jgi:hypothetical protein